MFKAALASEEQSGNVAPLITFIVAAILPARPLVAQL